MRYACCDERRLDVVKRLGTLNGLEYVEVIDHDAPTKALQQRTLIVKFLRPPAGVDDTHLRIAGGERIREIPIEWAAPATALPAGESPTLIDGLSPLDHFLVVRTVLFGDFSTYRLQVIAGAGADTPPADFDPRLAAIPFSFKVECPSDFDCAPLTVCPPARVPPPRISYLARDYATFRRLMLDRLSAIAPQWRERNAADLGVTLVELLAYAADHLSYQQDAVATEAYLGTARRRVSLRRHARLMDYRVHEGCNARAWVRMFLDDDVVPVPAHTALLTRVPGLPDRIIPGGPEHRDALARGAQTFETADDVVLYRAHERMELYAWGDRECCLPAGGTRATVLGDFPRLKAGDVLVLAEERGPLTGEPEDADRAHRWAVRLTHVRPAQDPSGGLFHDPPDSTAVDVTEIEWDAADALPFPLCISARTDEEHGGQFIDAVSAAYGTIVLADHGRSIEDEALGSVPAPHLFLAPVTSGPCEHPAAAAVPARFRPRLGERPLTHAIDQRPARVFDAPATPALVADLDAGTFSPAVQAMLRGHAIVFTRSPVIVHGGDGQWSISDGAQVFTIRHRGSVLDVYGQASSAVAAMAASPRDARPQITLARAVDGTPEAWSPRPDLLASDGDAPEFVVEVEHDTTAFLRFGDGTHGRRPPEGSMFSANYRVGNGVAGNVGASAIAHVVSIDARLARVDNPLPAAGGTEPESAEAVRRDAPEAFRVQERAVTPADYAEVTARDPSAQRAAATFRWTGSWHTVFLTVDRRGGLDVDAGYERAVRDRVERYRMAGHDLEVDGPRYVPLELALRVCVKPDYFRAHVRAVLLRLYSSGYLPDGQRALFHPDNFTFGQRVYLSDLYAAAQSVEGVDSVVIDTFQRLHEPSVKPLDVGFIEMARLEIARLDNDPSFPERGVVDLRVAGGK